MLPSERFLWTNQNGMQPVLNTTKWGNVLFFTSEMHLETKAACGSSAWPCVPYPYQNTQRNTAKGQIQCVCKSRYACILSIFIYIYTYIDICMHACMYVILSWSRALPPRNCNAASALWKKTCQKRHSAGGCEGRAPCNARDSGTVSEKIILAWASLSQLSQYNILAVVSDLQVMHPSTQARGNARAKEIRFEGENVLLDVSQYALCNTDNKSCKLWCLELRRRWSWPRPYQVFSISPIQMSQHDIKIQWFWHSNDNFPNIDF